MHPSLRIWLYCISALALPGLSFFGLGILLSAALLFGGRSIGSALPAVWRARWLFLLLAAGYAYSLPGAPVLEALDRFSPSWPGVAFGALQMARLAILLVLLDLLVVRLGSARLLSGLHGILAPLGLLGLPVGRATVRIGLTLQAMEAQVSGPRRRLGELLSGAGAESAIAGETLFRLEVARWRATDYAALTIALAALVTVWAV